MRFSTALGTYKMWHRSKSRSLNPEAPDGITYVCICLRIHAPCQYNDLLPEHSYKDWFNSNSGMGPECPKDTDIFLHHDAVRTALVRSMFLYAVVEGIYNIRAFNELLDIEEASLKYLP